MKTKQIAFTASVTFGLITLIGLTGPACSGEKNAGPSHDPVVIGENDASTNGGAGPGGNHGGTAGNHGGNTAGTGNTLDGGADASLGNGGANNGGASNGGASNGGASNGGTSSAGSTNNPDGGPDLCPVSLGQDGCFNCPETTDDSVQFLNQCSSSDCSPFDNEARLPHLLSNGNLPDLP